jgi:hypothetical protein
VSDEQLSLSFLELVERETTIRETIAQIIVSDAVREECLEELRVAERNGWKIPKD